MKCHVCGEPAVDRCYTCGRLFCERHGEKNCSVCVHGIAAGDPRPDRFTAAPNHLSAPNKSWWHPQEAEDYQPPACYVCQGLARRTCQNCQRLFCADHAGNDHLCRQCYRSTSIGLIAFGVLMLLVVALALWGIFLRPFEG